MRGDGGALVCREERGLLNSKGDHPRRSLKTK